MTQNHLPCQKRHVDLGVSKFHEGGGMPNTILREGNKFLWRSNYFVVLWQGFDRSSQPQIVLVLAGRKSSLIIRRIWATTSTNKLLLAPLVVGFPFLLLLSSGSELSCLACGHGPYVTLRNIPTLEWPRCTWIIDGIPTSDWRLRPAKQIFCWNGYKVLVRTGAAYTKIRRYCIPIPVFQT